MRENIASLPSGEFFLQEWGSTTEGAYSFGNVDSATISIENSEVTQRDYRSKSGGLAASVDQVADMTIEMNNLSLHPENIALALFGEASEHASSAIADERHVGFEDGMIQFNYPPDDSVAPVVIIDPDGGATTAVAGVDYQLRDTGIKVLEGAGITDQDVLGIDYTRNAGWLIQALVNSGKRFKLIFDGYNKVTAKPVGYTFHKVQFSAAQGFNIMTDDFGSIPFSGKVLSDDTITGSGLSKFFVGGMAL